MNQQQATAIANEIIALYKQFGEHEYAGEKVSQWQHMTQAAELAQQEGYDDEVILAAFLHDIGHICVSSLTHQQMNGFGTADHEALGAAFLKEKKFSEKLCLLVGSHVAAKRYLTLRDPGYYEQLSEASKVTLTYQGGVMSEEEATAFEQNPLFELMVKLRRWDEQAKETNLPAGNLDGYRKRIVEHLVISH